MGGNIGELIAKAIEEEYEDLDDKLEDLSKEICDNAANTLKKTSPRSVGRKKRKNGRYANGWVSEKAPGRLSNGYVVHNKKHYRRTHLLEKGHQNRDGTRTAAIVHIKPVEEMAIKEFEEKVIKRLEG